MKIVFASIMEGVGSSRKIFEYMNRQPDISYNGTVQDPINGQVDFLDVSFSYPTRPGKSILNVNF